MPVPTTRKVSTTEAASLLGICNQRVRQLLKNGRIKGAKKVGRFWEIPLYNGIPKIISGDRGPKGTWRKKVEKNATCIHIHGANLAQNRSMDENNPLFVVEQGKQRKFFHEVEITSPCKLVYRPDQPLASGAVVYIEVEKAVNVVGLVFK